MLRENNSLRGKVWKYLGKLSKLLTFQIRTWCQIHKFFLSPITVSLEMLLVFHTLLSCTHFSSITFPIFFSEGKLFRRGRKSGKIAQVKRKGKRGEKRGVGKVEGNFSAKIFFSEKHSSFAWDRWPATESS